MSVQYSVHILNCSIRGSYFILVISEDQVFFNKFDFSVFQERELMIPNLCFRINDT